MARGRKALTAEQAERRGDAGKRLDRKKAAEAASGVAELPTAASLGAPEWLDADALGVWAVLMPMLATMSFVKITDHAVIGRYCTHLARWIKLNGKIQARGEVHYETVSAHGKMLRHHPDFLAQMKIETALVAIEDRIGLTPAARQALVLKATSLPGGTDPKNPEQPELDDDLDERDEAPDPSDLLARLEAAPTTGRAN